MREIEFRVWCNKTKIFLDTDTIAIVANGEFVLEISPFTGNTLSILKDIEVMQYTGVCDNHGNFIYEGDILSDADIHNERENMEDERKTPSYLIYFDEGCFLAGSLKFTDARTLSDICWSLEVVGNKFDNPELLEM